MYQLIFANLFPKYFGKIDNYGINAKIEFNTFYTSYLNQKNLIDWQKSNKYWDEFAKKTTPSLVTENDSDSICEIEIKEEKEEKKEEKEIKKAKKIEIKKRKLEEKLKENKEKMKKIKNK